MEIAMSELSMAAHWNCSAAGIVSYDFGSLSVASLGEVASMEVVESSGVFLPAADLLVPGYSWPDNYTLTMHVSAEGAELDFTTTSVGTWTAVGMETVTVPAGTFEALRVDGTDNITMSGFMGMEPVNYHRELDLLVCRGGWHGALRRPAARGRIPGAN